MLRASGQPGSRLLADRHTGLGIAIDRKYLADLDYYGTKLTMVRITPPVPDVHLLDFSRTAELIEAGYHHALARLKELR